MFASTLFLIVICSSSYPADGGEVVKQPGVQLTMTSSPSVPVRNRAESESTLSHQQLMEPWLLPPTPGHGGGGDLIDLSDETRPSAQPTDNEDISSNEDGGPTFDPNTDRNVTVLVGRTAQLHCRVRNLGNRTVSWVRHRDVHILTVGRYTYASDQRFSIVRTRPSEDWTLQIKFTQARDAGLYECQVSTQPHRSQFIRLNVVAPKAVILGGPEFHVDVGSHVNLTCVVQFSPEPPEYVFWHHHDQELRHDSARGGVAIVTDKTSPMTSTSLLLRHVRLSDSGKYSCTPSNADPASVTLHVLQGERPAAMQSSGIPIHPSYWTPMLLLVLFSVLLPMPSGSITWIT